MLTAAYSQEPKNRNWNVHELMNGSPFYKDMTTLSENRGEKTPLNYFLLGKQTVSCGNCLSWGSMLSTSKDISSVLLALGRWAGGLNNPSCPGMSHSTLSAGRGRACQDWCWRRHPSPLLYLLRSCKEPFPLKRFQVLSCSRHTLRQCTEKR